MAAAMTMAAAVGVTLAGCRDAARPSPPANHVAPSPAVAVAPDDPLGWLALGPARAPADTWLPVSDRLDGLTLTDDPLPPRVTVIGADGSSAQLAVGDSVPLKYGCDNNELGVHPLVGARLGPGPAWILPPEIPTAWRPAAVPVHRTRATPTQRTHVAGGLVFTATREDRASANFTIDHDGRRVSSTLYPASEMDGAPPVDVDLTTSVPGIPEPLAVFSFAPSGPFLAVLLVPGYEGVSLTTLLVDDTRARAVDGMELYLYACAF